MRWQVIVSCAATVLLTLPVHAQTASRPLQDASGGSTGLSVPTLRGEAMKTITQKQEWKRPHIQRYFALLKTEANPDTRRHLLFELGFATGDSAHTIARGLTAMMTREPDERVRKAYIASLSALNIQAGLTDAEILHALRGIRQLVHHDPSWNVRVSAARTLVLYGDRQPEAILLEAVETRRELELSEYEALPITLQRLDTDAARGALRTLIDQAPHDTVRLGALWSAFELGMIDQEQVLRVATELARDSREVRAKVRAVSVLRILAAQTPLLREEIERTIEDVRESEPDGLARQQLELLDRQNREGGCHE